MIYRIEITRVAIIALSSLACFSCKPRYPTSDLAAVDKKGICRSPDPVSLMVQNYPQMPKNLHLRGWATEDSFKRATAKMRKHGLENEINEMRYLVETYMSNLQNDHSIYLNVHFIGVATADNFYIFFDDLNGVADKKPVFHAFEKMTVQEIFTSEDGSQWGLVVGKDWSQFASLDIHEYFFSAKQEVVFDEYTRIAPSLVAKLKDNAPVYGLRSNGWLIGTENGFVGLDGSSTGTYHDWIAVGHKENEVPGKHISAVAIVPQDYVNGSNRWWFSKYACLTNASSGSAQGCIRGIAYQTEHKQSEKLLFSDRYSEADAQRKRIYKLAMSYDSHAKIAFADGYGIHILAWVPGSGYRLAKTIKTSRKIDRLYFTFSKEETDNDVLHFSIDDGQKVDHKKIPMRAFFQPYILGEHDAGPPGVHHAIFQKYGKDLQVPRTAPDGNKDGRQAFWSSRPTDDNKAVYATAFDSNCTSVVSGGSDGKIIRWDIRSLVHADPNQTSRVPATLLGGTPAHAGRVLKLEFADSKDIAAAQVQGVGGGGNFVLMSVGQDNTVKLWNISAMDPRDGGAAAVTFNGNVNTPKVATPEVSEGSFDFPQVSTPNSTEKPPATLQLAQSGQPELEGESQNPPDQTANNRIADDQQPLQTRTIVAAALTKDNRNIVVSFAAQPPVVFDLAGNELHPVVSADYWKKISGQEPMTVIDMAPFAQLSPVKKEDWFGMITDNGSLITTFVRDRRESDPIRIIIRDQPFVSIDAAPRGQYFFVSDKFGRTMRIYNEEVNHEGLRSVEKNCDLNYMAHTLFVTGIDTAARFQDHAETALGDIDGLFTAGIDGTLREWPASIACKSSADASQSARAIFESDQFSLTSLDVSSDYNYAVTGTLEGKVLMWYLGRILDLDEE